MGTHNTDHLPSTWQLFRIWATIGLQSFGGGSSTVFLIQHEFIEKHKWLTIEEFAHLWNLCIMTPGINLIALTTLIGRKLGGTRGIVVSLTGLLLPSATITCLLTAGFQMIQHMSAVQAIFRGVIPATAGIMLLVGLRFAQPLMTQAHKEGSVRLLLSILIIMASAIAIIVFKISVIPVLLCMALLGSVLFTSRHSGISDDPTHTKE